MVVAGILLPTDYCFEADKTMTEVSSLQISPDGCFLAVTAAGHIDVYSLSDLCNNLKSVIQTWDLPAGSISRQVGEVVMANLFWKLFLSPSSHA